MRETTCVAKKQAHVKKILLVFFFLTKGNKEVYFPGGGEGEGRDCRGMW